MSLLFSSLKELYLCNTMFSCLHILDAPKNFLSYILKSLTKAVREDFLAKD